MEDTFWPIPPGPEGHSRAELYREYKRLINNISEKLRKGEVLSLAYQHDLPAWLVEVGPMHEPGYALRVLSQMEGRQVFSPTNLRELAESFKTIGRVDLVNTLKSFEEQHREVMESVLNSVPGTSSTPEPFLVGGDEGRRMSFGNGRRYLQDTFTREEKYSQSSSLDQQIMMRPASENRSRHGSMEKCSTTDGRSREGTPFESILDSIEPPLPQEVNLGIEMAKMSTDTLGNQLQLVQQMLTNHCLASPNVHHSLTNAYLLTKQISSLLNIASNSIKMVPMATSGSSYGMDNGQSPPVHSRHNSLGDITKNTSHASLSGQVFGSWELNQMDSLQKDGSIPMYRTHSQPQVFYQLNTNGNEGGTRDMRSNNFVPSFTHTQSQNDGETRVNVNQLSPLEFTDIAFGESTMGHSSVDTREDVPPPLPPRPAHMFSPPYTGEMIPRISEHCVRQIEPNEEQTSPVKKHGYHLVRSSRSVQDLNKLTDPQLLNSNTSKSLSRSRDGSYSGRSFKLFNWKK